MKVVEDFLGYVGVGQIGDDAKAAATVGTAAHVDLMHAPDEVSPGQADGTVGGGWWITERCRGVQRRRGYRRGGRSGGSGPGDLVGGRQRCGD